MYRVFLTPEAIERAQKTIAAQRVIPAELKRVVNVAASKACQYCFVCRFEFNLRVQGKGKKDGDDDLAPLVCSIPIDAVKLLYPGTTALQGYFPIVNDDAGTDSGTSALKPKRKGPSTL